MTSEGYAAMVADAVGEMDRPGATLRKVVLSRPVEVRLSGELPLSAALRRLRAGEPNCTIFSMPVPAGLLLRRQPRAPGGAARDPGVEPPPGRHRAPGRHRPHRCRRPARPGRVGQEPRRAPLRRRRHRRRPGAVLRGAVGPGRALRGRLPLGGPPRDRGSRAGWRRPVGVLELLRQLHPTPAVGGTPRAEALAFIAGPRGGRAGALGRPGGLGRCRAATGSG